MSQHDTVPWCVPDLTGNEARYVVEAVEAGQVGPAGEFLVRFEHAIAAVTGARHVVATSSGTAALHVAFVLAGVAPGDEVIVPAWTFVATANAVRHAGAWPIALDVDPAHWQLDPAAVEAFVSLRCTRVGGHLVDSATGRPVTAVAPVHLLGHPADMNPIRELADAYGLAVVIDGAQALGATYRGDPIATGGELVLSFNTNKIATSGGGGAILSDDPNVAARARYLINQARDHPVEYRHGKVGYNHRMSNLAAAVGVAQLERLDQFLVAKQRIFHRYATGLAALPGIAFQAAAPWAGATRWFSTALLDPKRSGVTAAELRRHLAERNIHAGPPWTPLHLTGAHTGSAGGPCPTAELLGRHAVHLPCSVGLTEADQERVIAAVHAAVHGSTVA